MHPNQSHYGSMGAGEICVFQWLVASGAAGVTVLAPANPSRYPDVMGHHRGHWVILLTSVMRSFFFLSITKRW